MKTLRNDSKLSTGKNQPSKQKRKTNFEAYESLNFDSQRPNTRFVPNKRPELGRYIDFTKSLLERNEEFSLEIWTV